MYYKNLYIKVTLLLDVHHEFYHMDLYKKIISFKINN